MVNVLFVLIDFSYCFGVGSSLAGRCAENRRRWPAKRLVPPRGARPGPPGSPDRNDAATLSAMQFGACDAPLPGRVGGTVRVCRPTRPRRLFPSFESVVRFAWAQF